MKKIFPIILLTFLITALLAFRLWKTTSQMAENKPEPEDILAVSDLDSSFTPVGKSKVWEKLLEIDYEQNGVYGRLPNFLPHHEKLNQKLIVVDGYMYPLEEGKQKQTYFMLSYYPINMCFFCGAAGPQSVIEVYSKKGIRLSHKRITLKGRLYLNKTDEQKLFYVLKNAELK